MDLSERPLTIGGCNSPATLGHELRDRSSSDNPGGLPVMTAEMNYEGQGVSPSRSAQSRRQFAGWIAMPSGQPERSFSHRGNRRRSGQRSGQSSGSSTDDGGMSLIDKEDLLDTIFISCDTEEKGRVPVSRVIQHIQMIVDTSESRDIDELALQLDPTGLDIEIDLPTYQSKIVHWIKAIQARRNVELNCTVDSDKQSVNLTLPDGVAAPCWKLKNVEPMTYPRNGLLETSLDLSTCSYGSLEAQGGDSSPDMAELQNRIEDLQFQIRKLSDHNMKLRVQFENTYDNNEQLTAQIESLESELKSSQQALHRSQSIRVENEELKLTNKDWSRKHIQMERERHFLDEKLNSLQAEANKRQALETKLQSVQEKLSIATADADSLQDDHRKLQTLLQEYKGQCEASETHLEVKNAELEEKGKRCKEMQINLEELYNLNQVLKNEKTELEVRLSEVRQELDSFRTQQLLTSEEVRSLSPASPKTESGLGQSLHSELRSIVSADENLPSPLCGNESFDFDSPDILGSNPTALEDAAPGGTLSGRGDPCPPPINVLTDDVQRRREHIVSQLQSFLGITGTASDQGVFKAAFMKRLDNELDSLVEKVASLSQLNKQAEYRANKLAFMLQNLREEYVKVTKKYEESLKTGKVLEATEMKLDLVKTENEELICNVEKEQRRTQELERNLLTYQTDLETAHKAQQKYRQMVETQLGELKKLFKDMEKKHKILQDNKNKQEVAHKIHTVQEERQHQSQLKAILDLVNTENRPTTVDQLQSTPGEPGTAQIGTTRPHSGRQVLDSVSEYLTELKNQLAKVKGQLISLKREKFSLEHGPLLLDGKGRFKTRSKTNNRNKCSSSFSLLLDALTLDFIIKDSSHTNSVLQHHDSVHSPSPQPNLSKDDSLVSIVTDSTVIDKLRRKLLREFRNQTTKSFVTVSTQTEIPRTPERNHQLNGRSAAAETPLVSSEGLHTETQTELVDQEGFKSASYRLENGADVRRAYLVAAPPPTIPFLELLSVGEPTSPRDDLSDFGDSFMTALSSPVSPPLVRSLQSSPDRSLPELKRSAISRDGPPSADSLCLLQGQQLTDDQDTRTMNPVVSSELKRLSRKSSPDRQDEAQRMANMLAANYARPNIIVEDCHADSEDNEDNEDHNANYERSGKHSPSTPRKRSPARLKRRSQVEKEKEKKTNTSSDDKDLDILNGKLQDMSEAERDLTRKLLDESKKASERFKNRRGRKWSPSASPDHRSLSPSSSTERSRTPSPVPPSLPIESERTPDVGLEEPSLQEKQEDLPGEMVKQTASDKVAEAPTDNAGELQEERTVAEGESDKEENIKTTQKSEERKDSEMEVSDIKADILKVTGALPAEVPVHVPHAQAKPVTPLDELRKEHKLQRKTNTLFIMPDLTEASESEATSREVCEVPTPVPDSPLFVTKKTPNEETCSTAENENCALPDSILRKLGLKGDQRTESMTESDIEYKFNTLQLAFKANQYTLKQRVNLQHRQRDVVERNIEKEIEALLQTLQLLEPLASIDLASRDYIHKIKEHVEVLQSSTLRLASKAESFGAVQQEGRLSTATDVMIAHVENLKRLFEREHAELEDAKKILQENRKMFRGSSMSNTLCIDDSRLLNRRALSGSGGNAKSQRQRRIGMVVGCREAWDRGVDQPSRVTGVKRSSVQLSSSLNMADFKEAKARLTGSLGAVAAKARHAVLTRTDSAIMMKNPDGDEEREHSMLEGCVSAPPIPMHLPISPLARGAISLPATPMTSAFPRVVHPEALKSSPAKVENIEAGNKQDDEVFQKGYEKGIRTQVSKELCELREQQQVFVDNLEELIDQAEAQEEEQQQKQLRRTTGNKFLLRLQALRRRWPRTARIARLIFTASVFLVALTCVIFTVVPLEACLKGGGGPITYSPWRTLKELLWPYTDLRHSTPPPR